ncbi:hypothetical protein EVAR_87372_1 [Eumeta japonica]|uniref:Reverse transcriptase domain-containing protein n=1 Tax=Eumeta variegata TaxID=151549 RepID=A0A4C1Y137_EUMVA|nr:hypothetical protein EVAR_87372_1 [Eumeta japonica]
MSSEPLDVTCSHALVNWVNCVSTNKNGRTLVDLRDTLEFNVIAPLILTHFPDKDRDKPGILDIALMRDVNLKLGGIETLQRLFSDHRPLLVRLGPTSENRPTDMKMTTNWEKVSIALNPAHITKVVKNSLRKVLVNYDYRKLPVDVRKLMRVKNSALCRVSDFFTPANRSYAHALQCKVRARVQEIRNENWSALKEEITPTHKAYWHVAKALKSDGYEPVPALRNPDNTLGFEDVEKAEPTALKGNAHTPTLHTTPYAYIGKIIRTGVPQGSTLSPLLYSAYTNDIQRPKTGVQLALFADDTTLFLRSTSFNHIIPRLQTAINELTQLFELWRIEGFQRARKLAIFYMSCLSGMIGRKSKMSLRNKQVPTRVVTSRESLRRGVRRSERITRRRVTRRRHLFVVRESRTLPMHVGAWIVHYVLSPPQRKPQKKVHPSYNCTLTATCLARAAINKSVPHFAHTPHESLLRGDYEENPKCGLTP